MAQKLDPDTFLERSREGVIVDVRTPAEFAAGHIPGAFNIPLFTDAQRAEVGTIYVQVGHDKAVQRGLELVGPRIAGIAADAKELSAGRTIYLYCWRGGMRSGSVAWLLETAGMKVVLLEGGYKAFRRSFEALLRRPWRFVMLSGSTGCGKTELLGHISHLGGQALDLEGLANHKGSAFGALGQLPQPTTEHFINLLHMAFRGFSADKPVWCEGESMLVGHVFIPQYLFGQMRQGIIAGVSMPREERLDRLTDEYGRFPREELAAAFGRISKRMGYDKSASAVSLLDQGDVRSAAALALDYYDKAYARSSEGNRISFQFEASNGDMVECAAKLMKTVKEIPGYED